MWLIPVVEDILLRKVSEEEAKNFVLTRYDELCLFIRDSRYKTLVKYNIENEEKDETDRNKLQEIYKSWLKENNLEYFDQIKNDNIYL